MTHATLLAIQAAEAFAVSFAVLVGTVYLAASWRPSANAMSCSCRRAPRA